MRKLILAGLLLLVAGLAGCGNAEPKDPATVDPAQASQDQLLTPQGAPQFEPDK